MAVIETTSLFVYTIYGGVEPPLGEWGKLGAQTNCAAGVLHGREEESRGEGGGQSYTVGLLVALCCGDDGWTFSSRSIMHALAEAHPGRSAGTVSCDH